MNKLLIAAATLLSLMVASAQAEPTAKDYTVTLTIAVGNLNDLECLYAFLEVSKTAYTECRTRELDTAFGAPATQTSCRDYTTWIEFKAADALLRKEGRYPNDGKEKSREWQKAYETYNRSAARIKYPKHEEIPTLEIVCVPAKLQALKNEWIKQKIEKEIFLLTKASR
ncbi:MAG: hypothetical protein DI585_00190 [Pseudomonas fluorescens]|nr:MAG: hypothetical protein DI585_00190 [Pseudomonas fluorescens]